MDELVQPSDNIWWSTITFLLVLVSLCFERTDFLTIASKALCRICHIHTQPCAAAVRKLQSQTMVAIMPNNI